MTTPVRYTALDLFAGAGGLTEGLRAASFDVLGAVELDPLAAETYRVNHPSVQLWERDIQRVHVSEVRRVLGLDTGELDLLAGCPPCQGFSTMRTRNGARSIIEPQNDLLFQFTRFVRGLRPKVVMLENVPGLARDRRIADFADQIRRVGYECDFKVIDAAEYGVPQRRKRMVFLASRLGSLPLPPGEGPRVTVADAIGTLPIPGNTGDELHDAPERRSASVFDLIRHIPKDGGSRMDAPSRFVLNCHREFYGFHDVYGRMAWNKVAPTITGGCHNPSKGRFLHPSEDRAITLREAALLQSFPRKYHFSLNRGKEHAALLIGNALPPALIKAIALPVRRHLSAHEQPVQR